MRKMSSVYQDEKNILITRDWESVPKRPCTNKATKITPSFIGFPIYFLVTVSQFPASQLKSFYLVKFPTSVVLHVKLVYKLSGITDFWPSSGLYFYSEDAHVYVKILNIICINLSHVGLILRPYYKT